MVDLTNEETRAISIVQIINFLPPMRGFTLYSKWLMEAPGKLSKAVTGVLNPTAWIMSQEELTMFVHNYGREFYRQAYLTDQLDDITYLTRTVTKILTGWLPLRIENGDRSRVKLADLMFTGGQHYPGGLTQLLADLTPQPREFDGGVAVIPSAVPAMRKPNRSNVESWNNQLNAKISKAFHNPGTVLNNMWMGFSQGRFFNVDGTPFTEDKPDIEVITEGGYYDAITQLKDLYGENWEPGLMKHIGSRPPIPSTYVDLKRNSNRIYETIWKGTSYQIMEWDEASRICDLDCYSECRLQPRVLCMLPDHLRIRQLSDLRINFHGNFKISIRKEVSWPGWKNDTRRRGTFVRTSGFKPTTK